LNGAALDVRLATVIEEVKGVAAATPVITKFIAEDFQTVYGIDEGSFPLVSSPLRFRQGGFFSQPDEVIVDTTYSEKHGLVVGDQVELLSQNFIISGVFDAGIGAGVMLPLGKLQELNGTPGKATGFFVKVSEGSGVDEVRSRLEKRMPHYKFTETSELQAMMLDNTPVFREFLAAMVFVSVMVSFLIVLLVMYGSIAEKTREIGILKSLGASKVYIACLILLESAAICGLGVVIGFVLAFAAIQLVHSVYPFLPVSIPSYWYVAATVLALAGGILGATYPAARAANLDPIQALGYE
jgi:putative ABC transport system permease protein